MERYLRNNPGVRWSIIFVLLLCLLLEGLLISNRVLIGGFTQVAATPPPPFGGGDFSPTPRAVTLDCRVVNERGLNLREQPTTEVDNVIAVLGNGATLVAQERSGDVPWLRVQAEGRTGWVSARLPGGQPTLECAGELSTLPEEGQELASANEAEVQNTPTLAPTITPEPTITRAPDVPLREGNGPDLHAARRTFDVALDGVLGEWGATSAAPIGNVVFRPENWQNAQDLSGVVRAAWDEQFLYLAAQVNDDAVVQESREDLLIRGDAVEFFWDGDLAGDFGNDRYNEDESQLVMSPGNFNDAAPSAWVYVYPNENFRDQVQVAATRTEVGYNMEMRIPWSGLGVTPGPGNVYGYAVALSDDDTSGDGGTQQTQLSTTPRLPYPNPTHWGNFILD